MKKIGILLLTGLLAGACSESNESVQPLKKTPTTKETSLKEIKEKPNESDKGFILHKGDTLVSVDRFNKNIWWELKTM